MRNYCAPICPLFRKPFARFNVDTKWIMHKTTWYECLGRGTRRDTAKVKEKKQLRRLGLKFTTLFRRSRPRVRFSMLRINERHSEIVHTLENWISPLVTYFAAKVAKKGCTQSNQKGFVSAFEQANEICSWLNTGLVSQIVGGFHSNCYSK